MAEFVFHDTHCQTNSFPAVITTPIRFYSTKLLGKSWQKGGVKKKL